MVGNKKESTRDTLVFLFEGILIGLILVPIIKYAIIQNTLGGTLSSLIATVALFVLLLSDRWQRRNR
jgi:uncharacterized membrane protein YraQ (UPF0718 family)